MTPSNRLEIGLVRSTLGQRLCIAAFVAFLALPVLGQAFFAAVDADMAAQEMRKPAPFPERPRSLAEFATLPGRFEAWLNDRLALRGQLVLVNNYVRVRLLGQSTSKLVALGRDDWLFYLGDKALDQARGLDQFAPDELDRWIDVMERRQAWLKERGIPFLIAVVPNKERVYREHLPSWATLVRPESRLDQIVRRVRERGSPLEVLDLTADLVAAKARMKTFLKADTHWTVEAAFHAGYAPIADWVKQARPAFRPITADDVRARPTVRPGGNLDLARMLGLGSISREDETEVHATPPSRLVSNQNRNEGGIDTTTLRADRPGAPKVVWFRDSFTISMMPFIAESFREAVITEHRVMRFDRALVEAEKPDVVVYQFVERFLSYPMPDE